MTGWRCRECDSEWISITDNAECWLCGYLGEPRQLASGDWSGSAMTARHKLTDKEMTL